MSAAHSIRLFLAAGAGMIAAAEVASGAPKTEAGPAPCRLALTDPAASVETAWSRHDFTGHSRFRNVVVDGLPVIEAVPNGASALGVSVDLDVAQRPIARWRWRVDELQPSADLRRTDREDFSAAVFFVFGELGLSSADPPTLVYAWTATPVALGSLLRNPRHPRDIVAIPLEGAAAVGTWREEARDLVADFRDAFGRDLDRHLRHVVLFSDDDQTGEPARAYYGAVQVSACPDDRCAVAGSMATTGAGGGTSGASAGHLSPTCPSGVR